MMVISSPLPPLFFSPPSPTLLPFPLLLSPSPPPSPRYQTATFRFHSTDYNTVRQSTMSDWLAITLRVENPKFSRKISVFFSIEKFFAKKKVGNFFLPIFKSEIRRIFTTRRAKNNAAFLWGIKYTAFILSRYDTRNS